MRSTDEMTLAIHARAKALRRAGENRRIALLGGASAALGLALVALIGALGGLQHRAMNADYAAATLLGDGAGGYVLAGVAAFMAGVATAVTCIRRRNKNDQK